MLTLSQRLDDEREDDEAAAHEVVQALDQGEGDCRAHKLIQAATLSRYQEN